MLNLIEDGKLAMLRDIPSERRTFTRIPFHESVLWRNASGESGSAKILDVSRSGLCLSLARYFRPGPALMFTFEDLEKLDPTSVQTLLRGVDKVKLGLALKGASEPLRDLFLGNMSERAGKILREDMEAMGPVRLRDVDEAQADIVTVAKDLADKGDLLIADAGGDDELVY